MHTSSLYVGYRPVFLPEASSKSTFYMYATSKDSGETALMRSLARALAGRLFDMYIFYVQAQITYILLSFLKIWFDTSYKLSILHEMSNPIFWKKKKKNVSRGLAAPQDFRHFCKGDFPLLYSTISPL